MKKRINTESTEKRGEHGEEKERRLNTEGAEIAEKRKTEIRKIEKRKTEKREGRERKTER